MVIGDRIRALRRAKNLTQATLAELIGTSASHVSRIESDVQCPEHGTLQRIGRALGVELALLKDGYRELDALPDLNSISPDGLLAAKCRADLGNSVLVRSARLIQAADLYKTRIAVCARYRHITEVMNELAAVNFTR